MITKKSIDVTVDSGNYFHATPTLEMRLKEMRETEVLKPEEERALIKEYQTTGNLAARDKIIACNQRFLYAVAKQYTKNPSLIQEFMNVGSIGFERAIKQFDLSKDVRFITYGVWKARCEINRYRTAVEPLVKKGTDLRNLTDTNKIKNRFYLENGRYPTLDELMEIYNKRPNVKIVDRCTLMDVETISLSSSLDGMDNTFESSEEYNHATASYNEYNDEMNKDYNEKMAELSLSFLTEREREIIKLSFGIGCDKEWTNDEIAKELKISRERVRQIKDAAIRKLKGAKKMILQEAKAV